MVESYGNGHCWGSHHSGAFAGCFHPAPGLLHNDLAGVPRFNDGLGLTCLDDARLDARIDQPGGGLVDSFLAVPYSTCIYSPCVRAAHSSALIVPDLQTVKLSDRSRNCRKREEPVARDAVKRRSAKGAAGNDKPGADCYHARMRQRVKEGFAYNGHDVVASYEGTGFLRTEGGSRIVCEFQADQDINGVVELLCHRILPSDFAFHLLPLMDSGASASFRGTIATGATVLMDLERGGRPLSLDGDGYGSMYFLPRKLSVFEKEPPTVCHRFLLTNFEFSPFTHLGEPPHHPPPHRMSLKVGSQRVDIEIAPLPDYVPRVVALWQTRTIIPTCELHIPSSPETPKDWPFDLAARVCKLLSVAAGTVIEWIVAAGVNERGERTRSVHAARSTKPYCSLALVPIKEFGYDVNTRTLQEFLLRAKLPRRSRPRNSAKHAPDNQSSRGSREMGQLNPGQHNQSLQHRTPPIV